MLHIKVSDTGPGIPAERHQQIFEPFGHADSPIARERGGTGLGLAISKRLAEQLGGTLSLIESDSIRGSTFHLSIRAVEVEIPQPDRQPQSSSTGDPSAHPLNRLHILLAEDSSELQSAVRRLLRAVGATVDCADDGREATTMAGTGEYDLILMDLIMPNMGGLEAARTLRSGGLKVPIIALTGDATAEVHRAAREAGCNEVLSKPFDVEHLIATIRRLAARHRDPSVQAQPAR
jgi:CheY-like chemotaxis protein